MIRSPLGLRLDPSRPVKAQILEAARLGAKGVVVEAIGELAPERLSETGRREVRHVLRSTELALIALHLPTRRPFDIPDQLDDRLRRAERAFTLAYELGTALVLARVGAMPAESEPARREVLLNAVRELGRRGDHRGVRLAIETGSEPGPALRAVLDGVGSPGLAASIDPASLLAHGFDPVTATRDLGPWVTHAYAPDATGARGLGAAANPRGFGFPPGVPDWEEYLGALEEIEYRGYLTIWPDPAREPGPQFTAVVERLQQF
jgi:sugar phosphate isomerase/epimerase